MKMVYAFLVLLTMFHGLPSRAQTQFAFRDPTLPMETRIDDLLKQLTLPEKVSLLGYNSKAVPRLGIPAYNWWNEGLHGVARAGNATIFPQAIGLAATFNDRLMKQVATVISTEARAKYNLASRRGLHQQYMGLTFWSPNINIFRDPRWGRGQETYGEDPFLTGTMGAAFVRGLQGDNVMHLKAAAGAKHFAVHSGPERERHTFNVKIGERDLRETYLYAFKKLVDTGVETVMCAYNRVNDEPCCTGQTLLQTILRKEWHFNGHVVTDCWALQDVWDRHKTLDNSVQVAAAAIKAGVNLDCSNLLQDDVVKAVEQGMLSVKEVDEALSANLRTQFKLGFFDAPDQSPYRFYLEDSIANSHHRALARKVAQQSMVLLKNKDQLLPLKKDQYPAIMVVGPNAASLDALIGSYHGVSDQAVNVVEGITAAVGPGVRVEYDLGCDYKDTVRFGGIWAAGNANITIASIGLTPVYEGEEGDAFLADGGADRKSLQLPASHIAYLRALRKGTRTPIIAVVNAGSAVDIAAIEPYADAILLAWYPGQEGGNALADILFGSVSPSGRLPITFYQSLNDLPPYDDYNMTGRTYRYFKGKPQYPFGYGLSYTSFHYGWMQTPHVKKDTIHFSVTVQNSGQYNGEEVVQAYIKYPAGLNLPLKELKGFQRIGLVTKQQGVVSFRIPVEELKKWDERNHGWKLIRGEYEIFVGGHSDDERLTHKIKF